MVSVDEHTRVAIEIVAQTLKLSEQTLLRLLEALTKLLESKEQKPNDYILDDKTKAGKQKISDLINKHEKNGGIVALDNNLTKQQLNDYQKELKKLGVDFSVVRNGKENYSFFFSAAQANVIEKALKNIVERKSAVLEKEEVKTAEKDLKIVRQDLTPDQAEKVKAIYDEITTAEKKEPKENNINYDRLSKHEKLLYAKLEELDEVKRGLYSQEVNRVEKLFENRYKQDVDINKEDKLTEKEILPEKPLEKVRTKVAEMDEKEQTLLEKKAALVAGKIGENEYNEVKKDFSPKQIEKIEKIASENIASDIKPGAIVDGKINANVFADLLKKVKNESIKEKTKVITNAKAEKDQVKNMLNSLSNDEQKLMLQYTKVMSESLDNHYADKNSYVESNKLDEMKKDFTPKQIEKVNTVVKQNISSFGEADGKVNVDKFHSILNDIKQERAKENKMEKEIGTSKQKKIEFSMDSVKDLDFKIKNEDKEASKDKNKKQSISR
ncbi:DUF3801 domain-containing protein [Bacillus thuringiensis]|uniref:DUF3801 domain-containing protein n=1 Tax=Bacillus thuringiensis TaxID=1428 RepID=UPI000BEC0EDB|nr:DUF3801 domain-containing protein [Bacillus thuringiensis]PEA57010.1 DUF3801 domain-containing protein [Bacillus thuringiensis]